jgi:hypothetical protein
VTVSSAQGVTAKGFKIGFNVANIRGDGTEDLDSKLGVSLGGFVTYSFNVVWAVQGEMLYTMKGASEKTTVLGQKVDITTSLNYLEFPILARGSIPGNNDVMPVFIAGFAPSFNLVASATAESGDLTATEDLDAVSSFDLGLVFGGGVDVKAGTGKVIGDLRYTLGLLNINDEEDDFAGNGVFSLLVGYSF